MKKILLSCFLTLILSFSMGMSVFASTNDTTVNLPKTTAKEHITFDPQTRINSDGTFSFYIHSQLNSSAFKVSSSDVTLKAFAYLNNSQDEWLPDQTCAYTVKMVKSSWFGSTLISLNCVTGTQSSGSTNNASTSDKYVLVVTKSGGEGYYLDGNGSISNFSGHT